MAVKPLRAHAKRAAHAEIGEGIVDLVIGVGLIATLVVAGLWVQTILQLPLGQTARDLAGIIDADGLALDLRVASHHVAQQHVDAALIVRLGRRSPAAVVPMVAAGFQGRAADFLDEEGLRELEWRLAVSVLESEEVRPGFYDGLQQRDLVLNDESVHRRLPAAIVHCVDVVGHVLAEDSVDAFVEPLAVDPGSERCYACDPYRRALGKEMFQERVVDASQHAFELLIPRIRFLSILVVWQVETVVERSE